MLGESAALAAAALWAAASVIFRRLGEDDVSPLAMNLLKCSIALVLLVATSWILAGRVWPTDLGWTNTAILAVSGIIGLTLGDTAFFASLTRIGSRRSLLLRALAPPMTALLAVPFLGEPLTVKMCAGMALTIGGVVWVILEREPDRHTDPNVADSPHTDGSSDDSFSKNERIGLAYGIAAAVLEAVGAILTKAGGDTIPALDISIVRLVFGTLGLLAVVAATSRIRDAVEPMTIGRKAGLVLVATFLGTYLGIWLSMAGIRYTYTGVALTLASTSPVWILPLTHFFEDETVTARATLGAIFAVLGIALLFVPSSLLPGM